MAVADFEQALPKIHAWIEDLVDKHRGSATSPQAFGFTRLPNYFAQQTLAAARIVVVDTIPKPPLTALGLNQFADFEVQESHGITYYDMYFVLRPLAKDEALHFHELIHTVQWRVLGAESFIRAYALGHVVSGSYRNNPFEKIAYELQARFEREFTPFAAEPLVLQHLQEQGLLK
jgi:hypothetical protein